MDIFEQKSLQAADKINANNLKDRLKYPYFPTRVVDDFLQEPDLWRYFALQQDYHFADNEAWPGQRTISLGDLDQGLFESFAKTLLKHLPMYQGFHRLNACFHLIDETYGNGWVHDDDPDSNLSGIIYLNKEAPRGCGTTFYDDRWDTEADYFHNKIRQDILECDADQRAEMRTYRDKQRANFVPNITVESYWNRAILFDPRTWHSADNFFGNTKETSRLNIVFYAKAG